MTMDLKERTLKSHPCFSEEAHRFLGRLHLPVAPACNVKCGYCVRKYDCANESRPGVTSRVLTPPEALERVRAVAERNGPRISVVGVAGPGDPLANEETFETLRAVQREYPELTLCVSTNGLLLPERLPDLIRAGVRSLTVTINAVTCETAERVYEWVFYKGKRLTGRDAAGVLLANQWSGLRAAASEGLLVKVNTVLIPGVNEAEVPRIAESAGAGGADLMNVLPLIPQASFASLTRPTHQEVCEMRGRCGGHIRQMTHCRQCRADAFGALGEDGDMELELIYARLGEDYCESVA